MARSLEIKHTSVFEKNWNSYNEEDIRYIVNQGGSRSSKSISILQCLIVIGMQQKLDISIVRKTLPSVKSIMKDFFDLLVEYNIYDKQNHNKSSSCYTFSNGSFFEFFGADNDQKLRGKKRDVLFCNEANELDQTEFVQLVLRTSGKIFIDFNPSDTDHFIYDVVKDDKAILIKSTYKDNPFLEKQQVEYIENLINVDENYYKIYALGERPTSTTRIYSHFKQYTDEPINYDDIVYSCDVGYNHAMVLLESKFVGNRVYTKELIYSSKLTISDFMNNVKILGLDKSKNLYIDAARPDVVEEFRREGFNRASGALKNVKEGIDSVKSTEVFIHLDSVNLMREYRLYCWKTIKEQIIDEPVKLNDDALDALRYAVYNYKVNKPKDRLPFYIG
jgi:phage terminase large subunit